jgi:uncharacterized membrane protein YebE (DUF533 family)
MTDAGDGSTLGIGGELRFTENTMFDARSILDILIGGGTPRGRGQQPEPSVFKDMLDQLGDQPPSSSRPPSSDTVQPAPGGHWTEQRYPQGPPTGGPGGQPTSLEELLRSILTQIQQGQAHQTPPPGSGQAAPTSQPPPGGGPEVGRELQDLLRQILQGRAPGGQIGPSGPGGQVSRAVSEGGASEQTGAGRQGGGLNGLGEALRQLLGQATAGAREGAAKIDEVTGISGKAREAVGQATGQTPEELVANLRRLIEENKLASGAALGGLGALVLGTRAGRSLAGTAIQLGGLALIGGLAYKAYQNYQQGKPPLAAETEAKATPQSLIPAPEGTGFEARAVTHDAARRYIRAMIAAAAADGRIDTDEQQRILGGLRQAGLEDAAQQFLAAEITSPATVAELAADVSSPEEALQVYTAARVAVDPDAAEEHAFLSALAEALGIDDELAAQVDAATRGAAA